MVKKTAVKIILTLAVVLGIGTMVYFAFPSIWGEVVYPLEYKELILKYSKQYNADPAFIAALIYSESHYNPDIVSRAGARGLMQIMPTTGASIAKNLEEPNYNPDVLFDPETNIRYGTWYITMYLNQYNGDEEAALAAYNGGGSVGNRYVINRDASTLPKETQGYIKKVISVKDMYKKIYEKDLYPVVVTYEDVASKLKTEKPVEPTFIQKIINFFKEKISGN